VADRYVILALLELANGPKSSFTFQGALAEAGEETRQVEQRLQRRNEGIKSLLLPRVWRLEDRKITYCPAKRATA